MNNRELVDEYDKIQQIKKELEERLEELRKEIIKIAKESGANFLTGTHKSCNIKEYDKVVYPEDKGELIAIMKEKGAYEQFSSLNYLKLGPAISKGLVDKEITALVKLVKDYRVSLREKGI